MFLIKKYFPVKKKKPLIITFGKHIQESDIKIINLSNGSVYNAPYLL